MALPRTGLASANSNGATKPSELRRRRPPSGPAEAGGGPERRAAATACGWCGGPITARARGPIPKWCSATCRHRAWEQARAAASGRAAVQIVERRVQVSVRQPVTRRDWPQALAELAAQLDDGRIYDRDLAGLSLALGAVLAAYRRRHHVGLRTEGRRPIGSLGTEPR